MSTEQPTSPAHQSGGPVLPPGPVEMQEDGWSRPLRPVAPEDDPYEDDARVTRILRHLHWMQRQSGVPAGMYRGDVWWLLARIGVQPPGGEYDQPAEVTPPADLEADRDRERARADRAEAALAVERAGLPEWHCPACGATTRARMADHPAGYEYQVLLSWGTWPAKDRKDAVKRAAAWRGQVQRRPFGEWEPDPDTTGDTDA